jgi:hypothetical protein
VNHTLYVPVRMSETGVLTLRTGRLESGERIGLAFTSTEALSRTLGPAQQWVSLGEDPLRDMLAPLGVRQLRVDPLPSGRPGARGIRLHVETRMMIPTWPPQPPSPDFLQSRA